MIIPDNIKCSFCPGIFCCPNCRKLHEEREHAVQDKQNIRLFCFICNGKPFLLQKSNSKILMEHIVEAHLPMHCRKCNKIYNSKDDFEEIEKCLGETNKEKVVDKDDSENKENIPVEQENNKTIPTQKIIVEEVDEELLTPLSKINLKWRRKSAGFSNSDASVSAISHHNQSQLKIHPQSAKKIVRTTSTPMTQLLTLPGSMESLCGSSYQASSIEHGNETDQSASITSNNGSPSPAVEMKRHHHQFPMQRAKQMRNRLPKAQTPLRQVMSKSIQRAIMQQRNERTKFTGNFRMPRKMIFDSMSSSDGSLDEPVLPKTPNVTGVLDLRTTPVLKRTNSAPIPRAYEHHEMPRHKSEESLIVEALIEEHYKRTDFREKLHAISDDEACITPIPMTPDTENTQFSDSTNGIFKSCLEDETPQQVTSKKSAIVTPMPSVTTTPDDSFMKEVWFTPRNSMSEDPIRSPQSDSDVIEDDVFVPAEEPSEPPQSRIWRLFTTVIKIASGSLSEAPGPKPATQNPATPKPSLVKRSLSHLGLIRPVKRPTYLKSSGTPHLKRKRVASSQSSLSNGETPTIPELRSPVAKKYKTISGRKPIHRMRTK